MEVSWPICNAHENDVAFRHCFDGLIMFLMQLQKSHGFEGRKDDTLPVLVVYPRYIDTCVACFRCARSSFSVNSGCLI